MGLGELLADLRGLGLLVVPWLGATTSPNLFPARPLRRRRSGSVFCAGPVGLRWADLGLMIRYLGVGLGWRSAGSAPPSGPWSRRSSGARPASSSAPAAA